MNCVIVNVHVALFLMIKANPLPHGLDKIPDAQGYLVINSDGAVLAVSANIVYFVGESWDNCDRN